MEIKFRTLKASEIECRVNSINEKGLSLLLYKDARVDQNILDETVGCMNWQRSHCRDNANCIVSIWDTDKKQWVSKEDTGTESYTEKEKGLASDSFKRACFNWGIGRELYSAPFIWVSASDAKISAGKNGKYQCYDRFAVEQIIYDDDRNIVSLSIMNTTQKKRVFCMNNRKNESDKQKKFDEESNRTANSLIPDSKVKSLIAQCKKEGVEPEKVARLYKVNSLAELTERKFADIHKHWADIKSAK